VLVSQKIWFWGVFCVSLAGLCAGRIWKKIDGTGLPTQAANGIVHAKA
jgi:hypothetical protein